MSVQNVYSQSKTKRNGCPKNLYSQSKIDRKTGQMAWIEWQILCPKNDESKAREVGRPERPTKSGGGQSPQPRKGWNHLFSRLSLELSKLQWYEEKNERFFFHFGLFATFISMKGNVKTVDNRLNMKSEILQRKEFSEKRKKRKLVNQNSEG